MTKTQSGRLAFFNAVLRIVSTHPEALVESRADSKEVAVLKAKVAQLKADIKKGAE